MAEAAKTTKAKVKKKKAHKNRKPSKRGRPARMTDVQAKAFCAKVAALKHGKIVPYLKKNKVSISTYYNWLTKFGLKTNTKRNQEKAA